jgi:hypothetical protein
MSLAHILTASLKIHGLFKVRNVLDLVSGPKPKVGFIISNSLLLTSRSSG